MKGEAIVMPSKPWLSSDPITTPSILAVDYYFKITK